ncbi:MAG: cytochrome-c oxidase, cbb3-type subunit II, partial [Azovibrio sp.]
SNMPAFAWMKDTPVMDTVGKDVEAKMKAMRIVGVPYTDEEIMGARKMLEGKTEEDALVAYLQGLGTALSNFK